MSAEHVTNAHHPPAQTETWISAAETAQLLHLSLQTVLSRAVSGKLTAKVSEAAPFTCDGKQNYLFRLEDLPQKAQLQYLRNHLPPDQVCALDLVTPRSTLGDVWLSQFLNVAEIIRAADTIRKQYLHTGLTRTKLKDLAAQHGISLSTLYRICGKPSARELSHLYLDPVYLQPHLPKTMCLWSADFAYALYLDPHQGYSQNSIFRELQQISDTPCSLCPYSPKRNASEKEHTDHTPVCRTCSGHIIIPHHRKTVNRLLAHIPPQAICYCREGVRKRRNDYGHFTLREKPLLVNELWQGDHHIFDVFVRIKVTRQKNDRSYEKEIAVRPVLTAWMDTATGCLVGWVISILPNADTIAEAFCRAVTLTVGDEFHGLPKATLVDCGKDYRSALLTDLSQEYSKNYDADDNAAYLNRRFAGLGLLTALGVECHSALPYHPQSKSIERLFGTLEREWICKLKGWCHNSIKERPAEFAKHLQNLLESKQLLTLEEFVHKFRSEILPAYHHFRETSNVPAGWTPELSSMSPLERYHALEKPYQITPDWRTLSALKMHHASGCKIGQHGVRFQNVWYWDDALRHHIGMSADIFYHTAPKPLAPSSITITVNGNLVCEAFPAQKLPFIDADPAALQEHMDAQRLHEQELKSAITRVRRSAAILPHGAESTAISEKALLRNECYTASLSTQTSALPDDAPPSPGSPELPSVADVQQTTSSSSIQEVLSFLFGE